MVQQLEHIRNNVPEIESSNFTVHFYHRLLYDRLEDCVRAIKNLQRMLGDN